MSSLLVVVVDMTCLPTLHTFSSLFIDDDEEGKKRPT